MQACLLTVPKYFQQIMGFLKKNFEVEVTCSTVCSSLLRTVLNVFQLLYATGCCGCIMFSGGSLCTPYNSQH